MGIPPQVWPALWLISEDLVWCPEWDMWEYFGFRSDVDPPYDNMGTHLCFGEYPNNRWRSSWLNRFDDVYDCESWHTYGFEWTIEEARWVRIGVFSLQSWFCIQILNGLRVG